MHQDTAATDGRSNFCRQRNYAQNRIQARILAPIMCALALSCGVEPSVRNQDAPRLTARRLLVVSNGPNWRAQASVTHITLAPSGDSLLVSRAVNGVLSLDPRTGRTCRVVDHPLSECLGAIAFRNSVLVWGAGYAVTRSQLAPVVHSPTESFVNGAQSKDGRFALLATETGLSVLVDIESATPVTEWRCNNGTVLAIHPTTLSGVFEALYSNGTKVRFSPKAPPAATAPSRPLQLNACAGAILETGGPLLGFENGIVQATCERGASASRICKGALTSLSVRTDGRAAIACGVGGEIVAFDPRTMTVAFRVSVYPDAVRGTAWLTDDEACVGSDSGALYRVSLSSRAITNRSGHFGDVRELVCSPGGTRALTVGSDGRVILWSLPDLTELRVHSFGGAAEKPTVALFGEGGGYLVGLENGRVEYFSSDGVRRWLAWTRRGLVAAIQSHGTFVCFSHDGSAFTIGNNGNILREARTTLSGVSRVSACEPLGWILVVSDGDVIIADDTTLQEVDRLPLGTAIARSLATLPTGAGVWIGTDDGHLLFWSFRTRSISHRQSLARSSISGLAVSLDESAVLVGGGSNDPECYEVPGLERLQRFQFKRLRIIPTCFAFSAGASWILCGTKDGQVVGFHAWYLQNEKESLPWEEMAVRLGSPSIATSWAARDALILGGGLRCAWDLCGTSDARLPQLPTECRGRIDALCHGSLEDRTAAMREILRFGRVALPAVKENLKSSDLDSDAQASLKVLMSRLGSCPLEVPSLQRLRLIMFLVDFWHQPTCHERVALLKHLATGDEHCVCVVTAAHVLRCNETFSPHSATALEKAR